MLFSTVERNENRRARKVPSERFNACKQRDERVQRDGKYYFAADQSPIENICHSPARINNFPRFSIALAVLRLIAARDYYFIDCLPRKREGGGVLIKSVRNYDPIKSLALVDASNRCIKLQTCAVFLNFDSQKSGVSSVFAAHARDVGRSVDGVEKKKKKEIASARGNSATRFSATEQRIYRKTRRPTANFLPLSAPCSYVLHSRWKK